MKVNESPLVINYFQHVYRALEESLFHENMHLLQHLGLGNDPRQRPYIRETMHSALNL